MRTAFVSVLFLLNMAAITLVLLNRSSDKIVASYVSISVGAAAAVALAIAAFGDQGGIEQRFPISFFVDRRTGELVSISTRANFGMYDLGIWRHASGFIDPKNPLDGRPYHLALQRTLIEWMSQMYQWSWRVESVRYDSAESWRFGRIQGANDASTMIRIADLARQFTAGSPPLALSANMQMLAVPPGLFNRRGRLICKEAFEDPQHGTPAEITISNDFCRLAITTRYMGGFMGLGEYGVAAGVPEAEDRNYMRLDFEAIVKATFSSWLGGNPQMAKIRQWASGLVEMMRDQFDEQRIQQRSRDARAHPRRLPADGQPKFAAVYKLSETIVIERPVPQPK